MFTDFKNYLGEITLQESSPFQALAEARELEKSPEKNIEKLAELYFRAGNIKKSVHFFEQSADKARAVYDHSKSIEGYTKLLQFTDNPVVKARASGKLGEIYTHIGEVKKAEKIYSSALKLSKQTRDKQQTANILIKIGEHYFKNGDFNKALSNYHAAYKHAYKPANPETMSLLFRGYGINYRARRKYYMALKYFRKELKEAEKANNDELCYRAYENIGISYNHQARGDKALIYFKKAFKIAEKLNNKIYLSNCYINIGKIFFNEGDYDSALSQYQIAYRLSKKNDDIHILSVSIGNLAGIYLKKGDLIKAEENYNKQKEIYLKQGNEKGLAYVHNALGNLHFYKNDYKEAIRNYKLNISQNSGVLNSYTLGNLGVSYMYLCNYTKAKDYFQKQLAFDKKRHNQEGIARAYLNFSELYSKVGYLSLALKYSHRGLKQSKKYNLKQHMSLTVAQIKKTKNLISQKTKSIKL